MQLHFYKIRTLAFCSLLSILVHLLLIFSMRMFGSYNFCAAVNQPPVVMVDLATAPRAEVAEKPEVAGADHPEAPAPDTPLPEKATVAGATAASPKLASTKPDGEPAEESAARTEDQVAGPSAAVQPAASVAQHPTPTTLQSLSDALAARYEKLTYLVSMHGLPIGNAELESKHENGVTAITLRMKTNAAISNFYLVDDQIETRHIDGKFIMTNIKQQEGSFKSDESFTINLRKKSVSWVDFARPRTLKVAVPTDDVLDTLSGIYYLRNRQLQVGRTETLHIFDSEVYADVPVEILRKEEMRLPNLTKVATLVVRPLQSTPGLFRRTGDLVIWMTDDDFKVPVKIVTSIAMGQVTAELISSESKSYADENKDRRAQELVPRSKSAQQLNAGADWLQTAAVIRRPL